MPSLRLQNPPLLQTRHSMPSCVYGGGLAPVVAAFVVSRNLGDCSLHKGWVLRGFKTSQNTARTRSVHKSILIGLGVLALNSPAAFAQEPSAKSDLRIMPNLSAILTPICDRDDKSEFDQLMHATCYSERYQAVSVLVRGNAEGMSGQKIADYLVGEFGKSHVPAVGFLGEIERTDVSIVFFLNGDYYGPYSGEKWREGMNTLVRHSAEAWYK